VGLPRQQLFHRVLRQRGDPQAQAGILHAGRLHGRYRLHGWTKDDTTTGGHALALKRMGILRGDKVSMPIPPASTMECTRHQDRRRRFAITRGKDEIAALERDDRFFETSSRSIRLFEHDLFRKKPVPTFSGSCL